jgi:hypothetical protein
LDILLLLLGLSASLNAALFACLVTWKIGAKPAEMVRNGAATYAGVFAIWMLVVSTYHR